MAESRFTCVKRHTCSKKNQTHLDVRIEGDRDKTIAYMDFTMKFDDSKTKIPPDKWLVKKRSIGNANTVAVLSFLPLGRIYAGNCNVNLIILVFSFICSPPLAFN